MDEWKHKNVKWCTIQAKMISWSCRIPLSTMSRTIVPDVVPLIVWTIRFHRCYILDNIHMCTQGQTTGHFTLCTHIQHSYDFWYSITSLYILHILIISSLFWSSWNQCWLFNWTGIDLSWIIFAFKEMHLKISSGIFLLYQWGPNVSVIPLSYCNNDSHIWAAAPREIPTSTKQCDNMMTSSNGNISHVTGPLWIPLTNASDAELWCFLWSMPE